MYLADALGLHRQATLHRAAINPLLDGNVGSGFQLEVADAAGADTVTVHGYIDRLSIGKDGVFEIHDYKTSR